MFGAEIWKISEFLSENLQFLVVTFSIYLNRHVYENTPVLIYRKFHHQKLKIFQIKILIFFSYFCSKHRLWVLVRTASPRRFYRVPTIYVLSRNKKNNVYPCKPQFYYIKVGFKGVKIIQVCFRDAATLVISNARWPIFFWDKRSWKVSHI